MAWFPAVRRLTDAVLYSSLWLAAAAAALTAGTLRHWQALTGAGPVAAHLPWLAGAATLLVYNLDAALPYKHGQPAGTSARKRWQQQHRGLLLALAAGAGAVALFFFLTDGWWRHPVLIAHLAALALLYSVPLGRWRGRPRALREIPLLKVWLIAYVWAAVTVGLPALALHHSLAHTAELLAQRLLLVLALALVSDIRDYSRDRRAGVLTFPGLLGVAGARWLGVGFLAVSGLLGLHRGEAWLPVTLPALLAAGAILGAAEERPDYYFTLLTDGVLLVRAATYFL